MKRIVSVLLACCFFASMANAEELKIVGIDLAKTATSADKVCDVECASACCSKGCPIEAAMAKLPKLTYLVGKEETCCSASAAELAKKHSKPVQFVVAKKPFAKEAKAMAALAAATEKFVSDFASPSHCKVSGKYTVAGKELCCEVMAGQRATLAKNAMKKVEMTYLVGEKECHCPTEAATLAKETGKAKQFVIAGQKTCCSIDARLKLAQAKYKAAVEALAKVDAPAEKTTEKS